MSCGAHARTRARRKDIASRLMEREKGRDASQSEQFNDQLVARPASAAPPVSTDTGCFIKTTHSARRRRRALLRVRVTRTL